MFTRLRLFNLPSLSLLIGSTLFLKGCDRPDELQVLRQQQALEQQRTEQAQREAESARKELLTAKHAAAQAKQETVEARQAATEAKQATEAARLETADAWTVARRNHALMATCLASSLAVFTAGWVLGMGMGSRAIVLSRGDSRPPPQ